MPMPTPGAPSSADPFILPLDVHADDIDHMGHVNNSVYLRWVQQSVIAHWRQLAPSGLADAFLWIARSHMIRYLRAGYLGDDLKAVVRIEEVRAVFATYVTRITRGETCLAEIRSQWCCLDAATRRPARIPDIVRTAALGPAAG